VPTHVIVGNFFNRLQHDITEFNSFLNPLSERREMRVFPNAILSGNRTQVLSHRRRGCYRCTNSNVISQLILFLKYFFIGVPHLATFIFNFSVMYTNSSQIAYIHPVCRGLNPQPIGHDPSALTSRP
jgi:hypothetical protein